MQLFLLTFVLLKSALSQHGGMGNVSDVVTSLESFCWHIIIHLACMKIRWHSHISDVMSELWPIPHLSEWRPLEEAGLGLARSNQQSAVSSQTNWALGVKRAWAWYRSPCVSTPLCLYQLKKADGQDMALWYCIWSKTERNSLTFLGGDSHWVKLNHPNHSMFQLFNMKPQSLA